jgi:hypothetical protein
MNKVAAFLGYWKITEMEVWAPSYIDLVVPGFIEFEQEDDHLVGTFQFGTVSGWLDCRLGDRGGQEVVEWSWQGQSDTDPGCGRGWAILEHGELVGRIFIHCGDDSAFRATRRTRPAARRDARIAKGRTEATESRLN